MNLIFVVNCRIDFDNINYNAIILFFILKKIKIFDMIDIRQELKILLIREGTSMRKLVHKYRYGDYDIPNESTLSSELINKRIRFSTVQDILDILGYELVIRKK